MRDLSLLRLRPPRDFDKTELSLRPRRAVRADASKYGQDYAVEDLYGLPKLVDWPVYPRLR
jgi:hypothetical protein